jgi:hypothetical protein
VVRYTTHLPASAGEVVTILGALRAPERAIWRAHKVARPRAGIMRTNEGLENIGGLMLDNPQSSAGIITKHSSSPSHRPSTD